jgi:hypothetical protein
MLAVERARRHDRRRRRAALVIDSHARRFNARAGGFSSAAAKRAGNMTSIAADAAIFRFGHADYGPTR